MKPERIPKANGRPREFDPDDALEKAMHLFWTKGFDGVSISDLTATMGVNRPSLYATFGNKEELFRKAFSRYMTGHISAVRLAEHFATVKQAVEAYLFNSADFLAQPEHPGCLAVVGALAWSDESEAIRQELSGARNDVLGVWRERFEAAQATGEIPPAPHAADLARYVMTVATGMTVQARSGATREELRRVAEISMRAWPSA